MNSGVLRRNKKSVILQTVRESACPSLCPAVHITVKNCFNDVAWDFGYGKPFTEETEEMLLKALEPDFVDGLSLLGGEPFEPENQRHFSRS